MPSTGPARCCATWSPPDGWGANPAAASTNTEPRFAPHGGPAPPRGFLPPCRRGRVRVSWAELLPMKLRYLLLAFLVLTIAAAAVQPLYRVDADVAFLPHDGIALNAHTGRVLWRFPRFDGEVLTDGHGLLIVGWVALIQPKLNRRVTRFCRLSTSDGKRLWCRDWAAVEQAALDAAGKFWYIHTPGRFSIARIADGQSDHAFHIHDDSDLALMPLPATGALLLERHSRAAVALSYRPGATALDAENVPEGAYTFQGQRQGVLLYIGEKHDFFLAAPLKLLEHGASAAFPRVSLDGSGFLFTDVQGNA